RFLMPAQAATGSLFRRTARDEPSYETRPPELALRAEGEAEDPRPPAKSPLSTFPIHPELPGNPALPSRSVNSVPILPSAGSGVPGRLAAPGDGSPTAGAQRRAGRPGGKRGEHVRTRPPGTAVGLLARPHPPGRLQPRGQAGASPGCPAGELSG